jgi:thymidylate kinase
VASQQIVISSRYLLSNYAYNCDNQIDIDMVLSLNHPHLLCTPDLTIYLRIHPDLALDRIKSRDNIDFLENSYHLYRASDIYDKFFADGFDSYYNSGFAITIDVDLLTSEEIHSKIIDSIVHTFPEFSQFRH